VTSTSPARPRTRKLKTGADGRRVHQIPAIYQAEDQRRSSRHGKTTARVHPVYLMNAEQRQVAADL